MEISIYIGDIIWSLHEILTPSCVIPRLLVVFIRQCEILVTTHKYSALSNL